MRALEPAELVIAIPAFNEVTTLERVVDEALIQIDGLGMNGRVFIVDDGSDDGTGDLADTLAEKDPRVTVDHHEENRGFTGAIRTALTGRQAEFVFLTAADGQIPMDILPQFWRRRHEADVVIGVRRPRADSVWRRFLSWGFHAISRALLGIALPEFSSVLLLRSAVARTPVVSNVRSAALLAELMCRATMGGARFVIIPYRHRPRAGGRGKGGDIRVALRTLVDLVRLAWLVRVRPRAEPTSIEGQPPSTISDAL